MKFDYKILLNNLTIVGLLTQQPLLGFYVILEETLLFTKSIVISAINSTYLTITVT